MKTSAHSSLFSYWKQDIPAALVVFLVALPLCLGIAIASGVPPISGLIAGIIGGIVVGFLSKSPLSVSGPAAGLTIIVLDALSTVPTFEAFLLAVFLAGLLQIILGIFKAGVIGDFIPDSVITGMLAAIGILLILKQIPHAVGYDADAFGDFAFHQSNGENTFSALIKSLFSKISYPAVVISLPSLSFLFWWDKKQLKAQGILRYIPGPLVVVAVSIMTVELFPYFLPTFVLEKEHMVDVPIITSMSDLKRVLSFPDFNYLTYLGIWKVAGTIALVASIETLLSIEAVDRIDPYKRVTPANRELIAQGCGNSISGLLGGLPVTSVIVRSSANVSAGGHSKLSTITHAFLLLVCVLVAPLLLNSIPLAALAAVLLSVGYKLAKPALFIDKYQDGLRRFIPFISTIIGILFTDLLIGVMIGVASSIILLLIDMHSAILFIQDDKQYDYIICFKKDLFFTHKSYLKKILGQIDDKTSLFLDISNIGFIDKDNVDIINRFIDNLKQKEIVLTVKLNSDEKINSLLEIKDHLKLD